jgi:hypothetical protein
VRPDLRAYSASPRPGARRILHAAYHLLTPLTAVQCSALIMFRQAVYLLTDHPVITLAPGWFPTTGPGDLPLSDFRAETPVGGMSWLLCRLPRLRAGIWCRYFRPLELRGGCSVDSGQWPLSPGAPSGPFAPAGPTASVVAQGTSHGPCLALQPDI